MRDPPRDVDGSTPSTDRRRFLRVAGGAAAAGLAATAGCLGGARDRVSPPAEVTSETDAAVDSARDRAAFDAYVERKRDRYGDRGVWGIERTEPDHDLSFVGAWTATVAMGENGDLVDGTENARAVADAAAALYRIPREDQRRHYQCWLWAAGRLPGERDDGALAATRALRRLEVGVELDGDDAEMGPYSPGSDRRDGPVPIGPSTPGFDGLSTTFPLEAGTVRVSPERTGFDRNAFATQWRGDAETQSINGTCETSWGADGAPSFALSLRVAADRRRL